ncbi:unnamed protein product [Symbiodinium sp. CCMP2456]|nr:unnamed protein product [Symbiodinium sp. CCMP2456]
MAAEVRTTKSSAKADAAEADVEAKEVLAAVVVTDTAPAEAAGIPEAAAQAQGATAPAAAKEVKGLLAKARPTEKKEVAAADADEIEQLTDDVSMVEAARCGDPNTVPAADPDETEQRKDDASTSAGSDKEKNEESSEGGARLGDLNKASPTIAVSLRRFGVPSLRRFGPDEEKEESLVEAARCGDLNKVKELLAINCDPEFFCNAWVSGQETFANRAPAADNSGTRPLIAAAVSGHSHVAWELLQYRADVNARDSDGLTALSAALCSPDCDIHMWFLLHHAADQKPKKPDQSSDAQTDIRNDDERTLHMPSNAQANIREDQKPNQNSDTQQGDIREAEFLHLLGNTSAKTMADIRADEKRTLRMLVTLLRGEGEFYTEKVKSLLKEAGLSFD